MEAADNRTWILIAIAVLFFFLLPGINHGVWRPDEPRVAGTCAEMARTGDYVVPHLNGKPFLEKPPLYYVLAALSGSLFGVDRDVPYRLVSLLFALLSILATCAIAAGREGPMTGVIAGGVLACSWGFFMLARWIQVDIALVFGVTLAMYAWVRLTDTQRPAHSVVLGLATGIAFMAKGLVGPALIAAAIITDIIRRRDLRLIWRIRPFTIIACAIAVVLPWILSLWSRGGWPFMREVLVVNSLMRFTGAPEGAALGHQDGFLFYFGNFPSAFLPWSLIFIPAFIASIRRFKDDPYLSWFIGPFVLLLLSSTKRGIYLVPVYPAAACMTAHWLVNRAAGIRWEGFFLKITWGIVIAACFAPFAGIFLNLPILGTVMGLISVSSLLILTRWRKQPPAFSFVALACIAMFSIMSLYYPYLKPDRDYIQFTRKALAAAGGREITLLTGDEVMQGILPMLTGKTYQVVPSPSDILKEGLYIWADRRGKVLKEVSSHAEVKILYESRMDLSGDRVTRLVHVTPRISKSSEFSVTPGKNPPAPEPESSEEGKEGF
jgi:4-amino-4-deoxy-L-arabinose transferase-like glycosyltransferase